MYFDPHCAYMSKFEYHQWKKSAICQLHIEETDLMLT